MYTRSWALKRIMASATLHIDRNNLIGQISFDIKARAQYTNVEMMGIDNERLLLVAMNPKVALTFELHPAFVARKAVGIANAGAGVQDQLRAVRKQHLLAFAIRGRGFQIRNLLFVDVIQISDATQHQTKNRSRSCSDSCHAAKPGPFFVLDALQQLARLFLRLLALEVSQRLLRR